MATISDSGNYGARATAIRDTAKWIAAVFLGAGAVLFSGLSFSNLAQAADTDQWLAPILLATLPVLAAVWALCEAIAVITANPPDSRELVGALGTETDLNQQAREAVEELKPATVVTYGSLTAFDERLRVARAKVEDARRAYEGQRIPERKRDLDVAYEDLDALQGGVRDIVLAADYLGVKARYDKARWHLLLAALVAVAAAILSGVLAGRAEHDAKKRTVEPMSINVPTPVRVFRETDHTPSSPCRFSNGGKALAIGGTFDRPLLLFDGRNTRRASGLCSTYWTWTPGTGVVVAVPIKQ